MSEENSYRAILRSSSIIAGAQVVNIATGVVKMKAAAMLLGPAGVGLAGLYMSLMQTASSIASLGIGAVGAREIATAHAEGRTIVVGRAWRALFWGALLLGLSGAALFWLLGGWISRMALADESHATDVTWLSLGVAFSVAAVAQGALLTGMRRVGDLAWINMGTGLLGALFGIAVLWFWGVDGLLGMVLVVPVISFLLGHVCVARLGAQAGLPERLPDLARQWKEMAQQGIPFMLSGLVTMTGHLAARILVQRELGAEALGQFQAAWMIGMMYLGFVLGAMGTDYYPRLSAAIKNRTAAVRLVNEQTEAALLLCAPVLLATLGLAPWAVHLLYSDEFSPAVEILRWQLVGDVLKVMSWPLGFVLLAHGAGKTFVVTEAVAISVFVLGVVLVMPLIGVTATGVAFLLMYSAYLPLVWMLGRRLIGFGWSRAVQWQALAVIAAAVVVNAAALWAELGGWLGLFFAAAAGLWALVRLSAMTGAGGGMGRIARTGERVKAWIKR